MSNQSLSDMSISQLIDELINLEGAYNELIARAQRSQQALHEIHNILIYLEGDELYKRLTITQILGDIAEEESIAYLVEMFAYEQIIQTAAWKALREIASDLSLKIAQAYLEKERGKPEAWRALKPQLKALRRQWRSDQETDHSQQIDSWIEEALEQEDQPGEEE